MQDPDLELLIKAAQSSGEIATGFARSGALFACDHAGISPDIMCLGKAITGGYMTLAATLTSSHIGETISSGGAGCFMHGPTFMGNALACSAANASLDLVASYDIENKVGALQSWLEEALKPCESLDAVASIRCLGAIGVVELHQPVNLHEIQPMLVFLIVLKLLYLIFWLFLKYSIAFS